MRHTHPHLSHCPTLSISILHPRSPTPSLVGGISFVETSVRIIDIYPGDRSGIIKYCLSIDRLISKHAQEKQSKKRSSLKRAIRRMRIRLRNRVDEVHKQLVRFLVTNYDLILLPSFETSQMEGRLVVRFVLKLYGPCSRGHTIVSNRGSYSSVTSLMLRSSLSTKRTQLRHVCRKCELGYWRQQIFQMPKIRVRNGYGSRLMQRRTHILEEYASVGDFSFPTLIWGLLPAVFGLLHGDRDVFARFRHLGKS